MLLLNAKKDIFFISTPHTFKNHFLTGFLRKITAQSGKFSHPVIFYLRFILIKPLNYFEFWQKSVRASLEWILRMIINLGAGVQAQCRIRRIWKSENADFSQCWLSKWWRYPTHWLPAVDTQRKLKKQKRKSGTITRVRARTRTYRWEEEDGV